MKALIALAKPLAPSSAHSIRGGPQPTPAQMRYPVTRYLHPVPACLRLH